MYEFLPVPLATTLSRAYLTKLEVSLEIILSFIFFFLLTLIMLLVSGSEKVVTIYGVYKVPPLTIADTAVTCCIGVTLIPCPNAVVASSSSLTFDNLNKIPVLSPFKSIPVFSPNPKSFMYLNNFSFPNFSPKFTNPGFVLVNTATF